MHLPWYQLDKDAIMKCRLLARLLGIPEAQGIGIGVCVWSWAFEIADDEDFSGRVPDIESVAAAAGWPLDDAPRLVREMQRVGFIATAPGLRVRGLDRYEATWRRNRRAGHGEDKPLDSHTPPRRPAADLPAENQRQTQTQTQTHKEDPSPAKKPREPKPKKPQVDPRYGPLVGRLKGRFYATTGTAYEFSDADGNALKSLIAKASDDEVDLRWQRGLTADRFGTKCATVLQLLQRWNELAVVRDNGPPGPDPNEGIIATSVPAPPTWNRDSPAGKAWDERLNALIRAGGAYAASQLERLTPALDASGVLTLHASDRFFAAWCIEHYAALLAKHGGPVEITSPDGIEGAAA